MSLSKERLKRSHFYVQMTRLTAINMIKFYNSMRNLVTGFLPSDIKKLKNNQLMFVIKWNKISI